MYMNYDARRKGALENRYRNLFPKRMSKKEFETLPEEERKRRMEKHKNSDFSWLDVHNTIMGENYYMADKYLKTRLSTVLAHIDKTIAEQKENKK